MQYIPGHLKLSAYEESSALIVNSKLEIYVITLVLTIHKYTCIALNLYSEQDSLVAVETGFCVTSTLRTFVAVSCAISHLFPYSKCSMFYARNPIRDAKFMILKSAWGVGK